MSSPVSPYTTEQMVVILKMFQANGNNLSKTAKEAGISRPTLRRWIDQMGPQVFNHNDVQDIVYKVDEEAIDKKTKISLKIIEAKEAMIQKIVDRIPFTNDMDQLTRGMKILVDIEKEVSDLPIRDGGDTNTINYIKIVTDQLILNKNELKIN
jgi:hypothetical protein